MQTLLGQLLLANLLEDLSQRLVVRLGEPGDGMLLGLQSRTIVNVFFIKFIAI